MAVVAHLRNRNLINEVNKQLKFWPILTLLGPRQSGKSTFLRDLVFSANEASYVSLDRVAAREAANRNPEQFLSQFDAEPVIIDEAYKASVLFDEVKASVDEDRRPGRFILTGSVRFSKKLGIRESFTGRAANLRFDSMTLNETTSEALDLKMIQRYLFHGGMPAVCFLHKETQIDRYWTEWLETSCQRDVLEYGRGRLSGDLAYRVLQAISLLPFPEASEIAKSVRVDARRVNTHLEALESLFLIRKWEPDEHSVGKMMYLPFDCGIAHFFKADLRRKWQVWVAHQILNQNRFLGSREVILKYNLSTRGSFADFSFEQKVLLFNDEAYPSSSLMKTVSALEKRLPGKKIEVCSMTDQKAQRLGSQSKSIPWSDLLGREGALRTSVA